MMLSGIEITNLWSSRSYDFSYFISLLYSAAYNIWHWVDEKGNDNSYGVLNTLALEKAFINKENTVNIEACHRAYSVDITKMEQTNTTTNVKRAVHRQSSGRF